MCVGIAAVEVGALASAALDWREARLQIATLGHAWLVGHVTLVKRTARRARWHAAGLRLLRATAAADPVPAPRQRPATLPIAVDERRAS